jgi:hypothetical protein
MKLTEMNREELINEYIYGYLILHGIKVKPYELEKFTNDDLIKGIEEIVYLLNR